MNITLLPGCNQVSTPLAPSTPVAGTPTASSTPSLEESIRANETGGTIRFEQLGPEQGLSQSVINCMLQDRWGFLWFGTQDGLNRYDGYSFKIYKPNPDEPNSISDRWITALFEDRQGYIWIGTRLGGLNRYDPRTGLFSQYLHDVSEPDSLISNRVQAIYEDNQGFLWIGTVDGLDRMNPDTGEFRHYRRESDDPTSISSNQITVIYEDSIETLWVGTATGGLNRFNPDTETFQSYTHDPEIRFSLSNNHVNDIVEGQNGILWIATDGGLNRFIPSISKFFTYLHSPDDPFSLSDNNVFSVYLDRKEVLWVGTNHGLDRYDPFSQDFTHYHHDPSLESSLSSDTIYSIIEDSSGVLWVGTFGGGLNKYNRNQDKFVYYHQGPNNPNSLSGDQIFSIFVDPMGIVWIGTYGDGLNRFDPQTTQFTHYRHDPSEPGSLLDDEVWSILLDRSGILWVGTSKGLSRLDPGEEKFIHYQRDPRNPNSLSGAPVRAIFEDSTGGLWIGTDQGLEQFEPITQTFIHYRHISSNPASISGNEIVTIFEDRDRNLWFSTFNNGLNRFNTQGEGFIRYLYDPDDAYSLSHNSITAIYQGESGFLWIGTAGGGLNRYDPVTKRFTRYLERDGLPSNVIYGILEDENHFLWLSSTNGISRFDTNSKTFRNYTVSDGLQSNEFNMGAYARGLQGEMYFGGINGLTVFDPQEIADSTFIPQIVLTAFTQGGQPTQTESQVEVLQEITIRWPKNSFEFEFAALSYTQPDENQYAYFLDGFDNDWNYIGTRRNGRYTNLPGGSYTLRLKGANNDGVWNEDGSAIAINVIPPFWETWTFRGLVVFSAAALAIGAYRLRIRRVQKRNLELEAIVQERTSALEKRKQEIEALYLADEKMLRTQTLDQVYQTLVDVAVDMLHADKSAVFVWNEDKEKLVVCVSRGFAPQTIKVLQFSRGESIIGKVMETGKMATIANLETDLRREDIKPVVKAAILEEGICSFIHLPIKIDEQVLGVFNVGFTHPDAFSVDTVRLFTALVQRAVLSLENTKLFEQTKELAIMEERNRLARDLHDSAKQKAFAALAQLGTVNGVLDVNPPAAKSHLGEAENLVYEVIQELTFLIQEMYPLALKEKGLATSLREYIFEWENRNDVVVDLVIENERRMPLEIEQAIYRIIQEAMANVARHSQANQVEVVLIYNKDTLKVIISDNGLGFNIKKKPMGMGLRSIKERIETIGGEMFITSAQGKGTRLTITTPVKNSP